MILKFQKFANNNFKTSLIKIKYSKILINTFTISIINNIKLTQLKYDDSNLENSINDDIKLKEKVPFNHVGIQLLSPSLKTKVFGSLKEETTNKAYNQLSIEHLTKNDIYGKIKEDKKPMINFNIPSLLGDTIGEHFYKLGLKVASPYLELTKKLAKSELPKKPKNWSKSPGWTCYLEDGTYFKVEFPLEDTLVLDVEVLCKVSPYPLIACAVSPKAWYTWVSPTFSKFLNNEIQKEDIKNELIPFDPIQPKVIIAHNASYDRARLKSEYNLIESNTAFLDTMSLHVAVGGLSSHQRQKWIKYDKSVDKEINIDEMDLENLATKKFYSVSSINSLKAVAKLYCNIELNKDQRDLFVEGDYEDIRENFNSLMEYCSNDVNVTFEVFKKVLPKYFEKCPHPISFCGILTMGKAFLPCNEKWNNYIQKSELLYQQLLNEVENRLIDLAEQALLHPNPMSDPWLSKLDWTIQPLKMTKPKLKKDGSYAKGGEPRPYKNQILPGKPEWYKSYYDTKSKKIKVTIRSRLAPYLLKLKWSGFPIYYSKNYGWCYYVPIEMNNNNLNESLTFIDDPSDPNYEEFPSLSSKEYKFYKIPHKDGEGSNCGNPLSKGYTNALESNILSSEYPLAKEALSLNTQCAYWISSRERITSQFVVYQNKDQLLSIPERDEVNSKEGIILPQITTMGTVTRRAVEATWMTASNAKKNRIGSELKSMIQAPKGYRIVGADVDSEELWISSLIGDAQFRNHGATAFGWMTLQGTKSEGTDMHSKTAKILGIGRGEAKVFNYGRIYGAGINFAIQLLKQFNPNLNEQSAKDKATQLYQATKGEKERTRKFTSKQFWYGGSESYMFNRLEEIATSNDPRTPVLNCGIPNALLPKSVGEGYMTSRVNWVVQSSGVDYLHLLIASMQYLILKYQINARFMISVHDEIRYLVEERDVYRGALALQISNLWTRAMFAFRLGFNDLPQSVAFFSGVDIDTVLRKEVDSDCVTPSNPTPIPSGICLDFEQLRDFTNNYELEMNQSNNSIIDDSNPLLYRPKDIERANNNDKLDPKLTKPINLSYSNLEFLKAQNCSDKYEIEEIYSKLNKQPKCQSKSLSNPKFHKTFNDTKANKEKLNKSLSSGNASSLKVSNNLPVTNSIEMKTASYIKHDSELGQLIYKFGKGRALKAQSYSKFSY